MAAACLAAATISVGGCASVQSVRFQPDEAPVLEGPAPRDNHTLLDATFACFAKALGDARTIGIGVGDVKDYTGKYSDAEGSTVTQGGALMVISALGKLGPTIRIHERFDTRIAELELVYSEKRQLGDGREHDVDGSTVPWKPYFGGTIRNSDYYIVGGITELNYNIQSGGAEVAVMQIGPKARTYTMNIAADLRIVDSNSLVVVETVSLQKQITGYEVDAGIFSFFGDTLVDVNTGAKKQEPLQLGIRTVLELGVLELVSAVSHLPFEPCLETYAPTGERLTPEGRKRLPVALRSRTAQYAAAAVPPAAGHSQVAAGSAGTGGPAVAAAAVPDATAELGGPRTYIVAPGDTVYAIGLDYGVDPDAIIAANRLSDDGNIQVGQRLMLPGVGETTLASAASLGDPERPTKPSYDATDPLGILSNPNFAAADKNYRSEP